MRGVPVHFYLFVYLGVSLCEFLRRPLPSRGEISPTVDANTTSLWLFKEGTRATVRNEVTGGQPINVALGTWVPGRENYAVATDSASEPNHGFVNVLDDASNHPQTAITIEAWVKINYTSGYMVSKNGSYFFSLGDGVFAANFYVDSTSITATGVSPVPVHQWVHLAATYQRNTATSGTVAVYINGRQDATSTNTGLTTGYLVYQSYGPRIAIGSNDWSATGSEMDGKVDALRISKIARVFSPLYPTPPEPATPKGNLVPNGDFEIGLTGWRPSSYGDAHLIGKPRGRGGSGPTAPG